jgi:outer membrane protein assembly factor BamE
MIAPVPANPPDPEVPTPMPASARSAALIVLALAATGCASTRESIANWDWRDLGIPGVYRATIQQGNVITQEMVDRLKPGMTRRQVRFILGEPILGNTFRADRWDYVYTVQPGARPRTQQRLTVWFDDDALARFEGDFVPTAIAKARDEAERSAEEQRAAEEMMPLPEPASDTGSAPPPSMPPTTPPTRPQGPTRPMPGPTP